VWYFLGASYGQQIYSGAQAVGGKGPGGRSDRKTSGRKRGPQPSLRGWSEGGATRRLKAGLAYRQTRQVLRSSAMVRNAVKLSLGQPPRAEGSRIVRAIRGAGDGGGPLANALDRAGNSSKGTFGVSYPELQDGNRR